MRDGWGTNELLFWQQQHSISSAAHENQFLLAAVTGCGNGSSLLVIRAEHGPDGSSIQSASDPCGRSDLGVCEFVSHLYVARPLVHYPWAWFSSVAIVPVYLLADTLSILSSTRPGNQIVLVRICSNSRQNEKGPSVSSGWVNGRMVV